MEKKFQCRARVSHGSLAVQLSILMSMVLQVILHARIEPNLKT